MSLRFEEKLSVFGICLNERQKTQFENYYELLIKWNEVMNLTAITKYEEVQEKHFVDSLAVNKAVNIQNVDKLIDVGTGAGFPGIPLKIVFPDVEVVLLDSLNKRVNFLNEVIINLNLKGIEAVHGRAEDYARQIGIREGFDLCVSRAVANLSTLSEYCIPYVKLDGYFIAYKSGDVEDEIKNAGNAVRKLGGKIEKTEKFFLPDSEISRSLIKIKKESTTPGKYPRKSGMPSKQPLI